MRRDLEIGAGEELGERKEAQITLPWKKIRLKGPQTCENQSKWTRSASLLGPGVAERKSRL